MQSFMIILSEMVQSNQRRSAYCLERALTLGLLSWIAAHLGLRWTITTPRRPLELCDLNALRTTDTHGWLLGHQEPSPPEPNYSGTYGDFTAFVQHMNEIALKKRVDLLLVDSGDIHDGTGLSDESPPGTIDGHDSSQFLKRLPDDALAIGNHELYVYNNTFDKYSFFSLHWKGRYLPSNANITVPDTSDSSQIVSESIGSRFAKFKILMGRRVAVLFAEATEEEPDSFLPVGHMPVSEDNRPIVSDAIRVVHPTTLILVFGEHAHVRYCVQFDGRSMVLQVDATWILLICTIFARVKFDNKKSSGSGNLTFSRWYLDTNRLTYKFHSGRNNRAFETWYEIKPYLEIHIQVMVLAVLDVEGSDLRKRGLERTRKRMEEMYKRGDVEMIYNKWLEEMYEREVARARELELDRRADNTTDIVSTMNAPLRIPARKLGMARPIPHTHSSLHRDTSLPSIHLRLPPPSISRQTARQLALVFAQEDWN
ncbi:hypothetical protein ACEPAH_2961 [Sanghuangporus vaninii]